MSPLIDPEFETHGEYVERVTSPAEAPPPHITAFIRTAVPALVGSLLAWLIAQVPLVGDIIVWIDMQIRSAGLDTSVSSLLAAAAVAGVIAGYYELARWLGRRWRVVEAVMLGSSAQPTYTTQNE